MDTKDHMDIGNFRNKGLICFEEITDYSMITDNKLLQKLKRKSADVSNDEVKPEKKNSKKKKLSNTNTKSVSFNEQVEVLNAKKKKVSTVLQDQVKKTVKKSKKEIKKPKLESDLLKIKKITKSNKSNSTSGLSMHVKETDDDLLDEEDFNQKMSAWSDLMLPKTLLRGLYAKGFYEPMPIQKIVLPEAIKTRANIVGTAQTGSGKTLAFGLPILTRLFDSYEIENEPTNIISHPQALILTPTRELAIQIKEHLQTCCKYQKTKIVVVVGGISQIKQERLLKKKPEIVVATPGRLMQMIEEGNEYLCNITKIKFLVIDEADRMIEKGHFGEMEKILNLVNTDEKLKAKRQNFLFSATLITKFSDENKNHKPKTEAQLERELKKALNDLVERIQMVKPPKVFDLTTKAITADNLTESKIFCPITDKDIYLYYFAMKYSGRTLVFANSIDCVRRLTNLFRYLKRTPLHLHANMDQKQRLKNLEKFNAEENSLLIASDVASRGLDIPGVMHVIHYQSPRSAEIYVHRSGRTARSNKEGLSVMLISPDEINLYRKIVQTCKQGSDLRDYPIDLDYLDECKTRVNLARKVDKLEHTLNKTKNTNNWYEKNAKLLDIELDDEILKETRVDTDKNLKEKRELHQIKAELDRQLKKMIFPKYLSKNYLRSENLTRIASINTNDKVALTEMKTLDGEKKRIRKKFTAKLIK